MRRTRRADVVAAVGITVAVAALVAGCTGPSARDASPTSTDPAACRALDGPVTTLAAADGRAPQIAVGPDGLHVAVWESRVGGPVEAATREPGRSWSDPTELGGSGAARPVVAVDRDGTVVAWEGFGDGGRAVFAVAGDHRRWDAPVALSGAGSRATEPAVAAAEGVRLVAWTEPDRAAVVVAEAPTAGGGWRSVRIPTGGGPVSRVDLATTADGVVAMWLRGVTGGRVAEASVRDGRGRWSAPVVLTPTDSYASDAVLAGGEVAVAAWRVDVAPGVMDVRARVLSDGAWTGVTTLATGVGRPAGLSRSDTQSLAPAVAAGPLGATGRPGAAAAWSQRRSTSDGPVEEVVASVWDPTTGWSSPDPVSRPPAEQAGGAAVAAGRSGHLVMAWESLVGDRQTVRVGATGGTPGGAAVCCADLVPPGEEASGPRLAVTPDGAAVAVWVGTNRFSIQTADVPATCR